MRKKAVELPGVTLGEGMPKVCVPVMGADARALRAAADAAQAAVALAADASYQKKMAHSEPWQIKKLYIHLYEQNPVKMDWRKPLAAFEGRTAFDVACRAFACHISQQKTDYHVEDFGPYDNSRFGLAFSAIGEDTRKDDFFEHVE